MITFIFLGAIVIVGGLLALVAYTSNNRKRAGQSEKAAQASAAPVERRSE